MSTKTCRYCAFRSEYWWPVYEHERDEHRSERWRSFAGWVVQLLLVAMTCGLVIPPLCDVVARYWGWR